MASKKDKVVDLETAVIRFAGDSGDGMQLTGNLFSDSTAFAGNDFVLGQDYEMIESARLLDPSEYNVNNALGYISLNQALNGLWWRG